MSRYKTLYWLQKSFSFTLFVLHERIPEKETMKFSLFHIVFAMLMTQITAYCEFEPDGVSSADKFASIMLYCADNFRILFPIHLIDDGISSAPVEGALLVNVLWGKNSILSIGFAMLRFGRILVKVIAMV